MIIVLGMPGAGKTTQTKLLAEFLNCPWFSMGQLIREQSTGDERTRMLHGKIIDDDTTLEILSEALKTVDTVNSESIVEGNPRSVTQAKWWVAKIKSGQIKLTGVVHLSLDVKAAKERLAKRGRIDDNSEKVVIKRIEEYKRAVLPALAYLKQQGVEVHEVDAGGTIEEVTGRIQKALGLKNA